jgi:hypothetical protein
LENTAFPLRQKTKVDMLSGVLEVNAALVFVPARRDVKEEETDRLAPKKPVSGLAAAMDWTLVLLTEKFVVDAVKSLAI